MVSTSITLTLKKVKAKYQKEIETKLEDKDIAQTNWTDIANVIKDTAKNTIGIKSNNQKPQPNDKIQEISKEKYKIKLEIESCRDNQQIKELKTKRNRIKKNIKSEIKKDKERVELDRIEDIEFF